MQRLVGANCWLPLDQKQSSRRPAAESCCCCIALRYKLKLSRKQSLWPEEKTRKRNRRQLKSQRETRIPAILQLLLANDSISLDTRHATKSSADQSPPEHPSSNLRRSRQDVLSNCVYHLAAPLSWRRGWLGRGRGLPLIDQMIDRRHETRTSLRPATRLTSAVSPLIATFFSPI